MPCAIGLNVAILKDTTIRKESSQQCKE